MSKAFTKESDIEEGLDADEKDPVLPPGAKNYMTPSGEAALREELKALAGNSSPDAQRRMRLVQRRLDSAAVIDPASQRSEKVVFGATVTVRDEQERTRTYQLVGIDETDPKAGRVSWLSPIAQALLGARVGDAVSLQTPKGDEELEVLAIEYR